MVLLLSEVRKRRKVPKLDSRKDYITKVVRIERQWQHGYDVAWALSRMLFDILCCILRFGMYVRHVYACGYYNWDQFI